LYIEFHPQKVMNRKQKHLISACCILSFCFVTITYASFQRCS
jgi:hypothetical protein